MANHRAVSRIAGPSERCISSFIVLRGISVWYHSADASPVSTAHSVLAPDQAVVPLRPLHAHVPLLSPPRAANRPLGSG